MLNAQAATSGVALPDYVLVRTDNGLLQAIEPFDSGNPALLAPDADGTVTRVYRINRAGHGGQAVSYMDSTAEVLRGTNRSTGNISASQIDRPTGEKHYVLFNKTHKNSMPIPKGVGPNNGRLQSHHGLQKEWAQQNLKQYHYDPDLAPTITLETGKGFPHTYISNAQNSRRLARISAGKDKWNSTLQDELSYIIVDLSDAGFSLETIKAVMEQQYRMLDKLKVPYRRIDFKWISKK